MARSDRERYADRLEKYLPALMEITELTQQESLADNIDEWLQKYLPLLREAFSSEGAFVANEKREIVQEDSVRTHLFEKTLPDTPKIEELISEETPVAVSGKVPECSELEVQSLLIVCLETPFGRRLVGVYNVKDTSDPYMTEDKQLLQILVKFLESGMSQSHFKACLNRYFWARILGECSYLSRASEDFANAKYPGKFEPANSSDPPSDKLFEEAELDVLIADYLDAELCDYMLLPPERDGTSWGDVRVAASDKPSGDGEENVLVSADASSPGNGTTGNVDTAASKDYQKDVWERLLEIVTVEALEIKIVDEKGEVDKKKVPGFFVTLRDNEYKTIDAIPEDPRQAREDGLSNSPEDCHGEVREQTEQPPKNYPQSALALARICLWGGYFANGASVPDCPQNGAGVLVPPEGFPSDEQMLEFIASLKEIEGVGKLLTGARSSDLFWTVPCWLLEKTKPDTLAPPDLLMTDWVRTIWQQIHYLARDGIRSPLPERIAEIDKLYRDARDRTLRVLQCYLQDQLSEGEEHALRLSVDSDWLVAWLASNALLSRGLNAYYHLPPWNNNEDQDKVSPLTKVRYVMHLSHHVLYALHCARHDVRRKEFLDPKPVEGQKKVYEKKENVTQVDQFRRPPFADVSADLSISLSKAQLYVLCEYAYREIGVHRELRIFELLTSQLSLELRLYAASDFYRDHLYHAMDVCLLGELLLRSAPPSDGSHAQCGDMASAVVERVEGVELGQLLQNWYVAALCHDLGYVIEQAGKLVEPIQAINGDGLDEFKTSVEGGLEAGKDAIRETLKWIPRLEPPVNPRVSAHELDKVNPTDHGVAAWLHLRRWAKGVNASYASLAHALTAVLRHNLTNQSINICEEPLTLLLMLCDNIQEWGRPRVGVESLAHGVMETLRFSKEPEFERKVRVRKLLIRGLETDTLEPVAVLPRTCKRCTKNPCEGNCLRVHTRIGQSGLTFELEHKEARTGDFEPVISWLLLCRNLQGLDCSKEEEPLYNITITLKHTPPRIWDLLFWPLEMDLLEEYANTHKDATYLCEWIGFARNGERGIRYEGNRESGKETFTIELHKLKTPLKRGLRDKAWEGFFKWKWRWLGQKFVNLSLGDWFPDKG